jgi:hypothetical protein
MVPRGLRPFDAADAGFFLELLPGPRDREGLPDSLRFWKTRIEQIDADDTFTVGLLCGPSGCGKSSFVKAGLLPRLAGHVTSVYVEAAAADTESRLLKALRKRCPELPQNLGLVKTLAALRRGVRSDGIHAVRGTPAPMNRGTTNQKVLIVLDQFEQWLHARRDDPNAELVRALRHCDGAHVQCLLLVRDDFGMTATRFLRELEVRIVQGDNFATVDLFDPAHARKVLTEFGRAFGRLPAAPAEPAPEQASFLGRAVEGLSGNGKVIPVRLALFAEMVKGKPWAPVTLKEVGGTEGIGVTFLEETLAGPGANPTHRLHQKAARAVLEALLPEQGSDIKGHRRSRQDLLAASGYGRRPGDFEELLRILDTELRLVTPTEPEAAPEGDIDPAIPSRARSESSSGGSGLPPLTPLEDSLRARLGHDPAGSPDHYYQLTPDYLVPALRQWLTRKRRETVGGRAELQLAERAALWAALRQNRHLPAWWEWLNIRLFTRPSDWTGPERQLMRRAGRYHAVRGAALGLLVAVLALAGVAISTRVVAQNRATHAAGLFNRLLDADIALVPGIVADLDDYRPEAQPLLEQEHARAKANSPRKLRTALGLLPVDRGQVRYLYGRLLDAKPGEVAILRTALLPYRPELTQDLWRIAARPPKDKEGRRLCAAAALAVYDPGGPAWARVGAALAPQLAAINPEFFDNWRKAFAPIKAQLVRPLSDVFRDRREGRIGERRMAASFLADYAQDRPELLADLLMDADDKQFGVLLPVLARHGEGALKPLLAELDRKATFRWDDSPLDPAWRAADPDVVRRLEAAEGLLAQRFALCQTMPWDEFLMIAERLRPCGYRPVRVRPYLAEGAVAVAAIWARDGRPWRLAHGMTAADVRQEDERQQKQGYRPVDVAGYVANSGGTTRPFGCAPNRTRSCGCMSASACGNIRPRGGHCTRPAFGR